MSLARRPPRRTCACGCGTFQPKRDNQTYATESCRARAKRARDGRELDALVATVARLSAAQTGDVPALLRQVRERLPAYLAGLDDLGMRHLRAELLALANRVPAPNNGLRDGGGRFRRLVR